VVDSPPLLSFADAAVLASVTQGVLLVVRAGKTRRDDAIRALDSLAAVRARVLGAVLTGTHAEGITEWRPARDPEPRDHGTEPEPEPSAAQVRATVPPRHPD